ncbi:hypothetical protein EJ06DRAFT_523503 [Trichodelitschia bisporula]|uniref:Uncharacterized protein n=1 Tax=Trichodelitschia bisporula TaxID=703511 RepID=A0A6G1HQ60_9PEZI|nr:hypothetical protein EJ06DRAFT_523503 [Trichodelitschia bisporula]
MENHRPAAFISGRQFDSAEPSILTIFISETATSTSTSTPSPSILTSTSTSTLPSPSPSPSFPGNLSAAALSETTVPHPSPGAIAGVVLGSLAFAFLGAYLIYILLRRLSRPNSPLTLSDPESTPRAPPPNPPPHAMSPVSPMSPEGYWSLNGAVFRSIGESAYAMRVPMGPGPVAPVYGPGRGMSPEPEELVALFGEKEEGRGPVELDVSEVAAPKYER